MRPSPAVNFARFSRHTWAALGFGSNTCQFFPFQPFHEGKSLLRVPAADITNNRMAAEHLFCQADELECNVCQVFISGHEIETGERKNYIRRPGRHHRRQLVHVADLLKRVPTVQYAMAMPKLIPTPVMAPRLPRYERKRNTQDRHNEREQRDGNFL